MRISVLITLLLATSFAYADDAITNVRWLKPTPIEQAALDDLSKGRIHPLPLAFTPFNTTRPKVPLRREVVADRNEYMADDPVGQFIVVLLGENVTEPKAALEIKVLEGDKGEKVVATKTLAPASPPWRRTKKPLADPILTFQTLPQSSGHAPTKALRFPHRGKQSPIT